MIDPVAWMLFGLGAAAGGRAGGWCGGRGLGARGGRQRRSRRAGCAGLQLLAELVEIPDQGVLAGLLAGGLAGEQGLLGLAAAGQAGGALPMVWRGGARPR